MGDPSGPPLQCLRRASSVWAGDPSARPYNAIFRVAPTTAILCALCALCGCHLPSQRQTACANDDTQRACAAAARPNARRVSKPRQPGLCASVMRSVSSTPSAVWRKICSCRQCAMGPRICTSAKEVGVGPGSCRANQRTGSGPSHSANSTSPSVMDLRSSRTSCAKTGGGVKRLSAPGSSWKRRKSARLALMRARLAEDTHGTSRTCWRTALI